MITRPTLIMKSFRIPKYLHRPAQLLWFEQDEWTVGGLGYVLGLFLGGWFWWALIVLPFIYIKIKKNYPRGCLIHTQYRMGLLKLHGYPDGFTRKFQE